MKLIRTRPRSEFGQKVVPGLDLAARHPDFSELRWRAIVKDGGRFLGVRGVRLPASDGGRPYLFGVHPIAPSTRFDTMGLVPIISGGGGDFDESSGAQGIVYQVELF